MSFVFLKYAKNGDIAPLSWSLLAVQAVVKYYYIKTLKSYFKWISQDSYGYRYVKIANKNVVINLLFTIIFPNFLYEVVQSSARGLDINKTRKTRGGLKSDAFFCLPVDGPITGGLISGSLRYLR